MNKNITVSQALDEALLQAMELDPNVIAFGPGVGTSSQVFGTTKSAYLKYGDARVFDTPVSEQALTQMAAGAALAGMRPILIHQRFDFMLYSLDAIYNWISLWRYKSAGKSGMPLVIRAVVGKGWGQGPQHAKNMPSIFAHCPGLRVVMPTNPADAKGLLIASIFSNDPVIFIEERSLHSMSGSVPKEIYYVDLDEPEIILEGSGVTIVTYGSGLKLTNEIATIIKQKANISSEIICLKSLAPLNLKSVIHSLKKTGKLVVVENTWPVCGIGSEIISQCCENIEIALKTNPIKISWPHSHVPMSAKAEEEFYPNANISADKILNSLSQSI